MLDPQEKHAFDGLVTRLRADDPAFVRRIDELNRPPHRLRQALAIALWTLAPVFVLVGGWTGLLIAAAGAGYGAYLLSRRPGRPGLADGSARHSRTDLSDRGKP